MQRRQLKIFSDHYQNYSILENKIDEFIEGMEKEGWCMCDQNVVSSDSLASTILVFLWFVKQNDK